MKKMIFFMTMAAVIAAADSCKVKQKTAQAPIPATDNAAMLAGKHWQLVELNGQAVETEAFIKFGADFRFSGNLGCNLMNGTYELAGDARIRFGQVVSTKKMCLSMIVETEFAKTLEIADSYYVSDNELILNRARMSPLAKFKSK